jgi:hypothetical protein
LKRRLVLQLCTLSVVGCCTWVGTRSARADEAVSAPAAVTTTTAEGQRRVDVGLLAALPAALGTGLSGGVSAGVLHAGWLTWGLRASYSQATEYTTTWATTHHETRLRAVGVLQRAIGRASVGLRLGLGATLVYESRLRAQAARLGDAGTSLNTSAWAALPGADLEAFIALPIVAPFGLGLSAGPSAHWVQGGVSPGWLVQLSAVWWP